MPIRRENRERYPADWAEISREIREDRAGGRCECVGECGAHLGRCDARQGLNHPLTNSRVVLTVAHLDHKPENVELANLLAMCQRCHNVYDGPMRRAGIRERRDRAAGQGKLFEGKS